MLKIHKFLFGPFLENTYILWDDSTGECAVVDPGCIDKNEENKISEFIIDEKLNVKFLINTHCHIDHIIGNAFVKQNYDCIFLAPHEDMFLLKRMVEQAKLFGVKAEASPMPDNFISSKENLFLGKIEFSFIFTPGHTPGEFCIYFENEKVCITGDVLFKDGIGRTDLWGGSYETLINSITTKLLVLPDETKIYPGHGEDSTIGTEKRNNPFLRNN